MTHSTSGRTPPTKSLNGQVRLKQEARASSRENTLSHDCRDPTPQISRELASLLAKPETRQIGGRQCRAGRVGGGAHQDSNPAFSASKALDSDL